MWTGIKLIAGKIPAEDYLILALVLLIAYGWFRIHYLESSNDSLKASVSTLKFNVKAATEANVSNLKTITDLRAANKRWQDFADTTADALTAAAIRIRSSTNENQKLLTDVLKSRLEIFKQPSCQELANLDFSSCPGLADSLRGSARRNFDPVDPGVDAGAAESAGGSH